MANEIRDSLLASVVEAKARQIELQVLIDEREALLAQFPPEGPPLPLPLPVINSFTATPATGAPGVAVTLAWNVTGAATVTIDQGVGTVAASGTKAVTPAATIAYKLTATSATGSVNQSKTVTVTATAPPPPPPPGALPVAEDASFTLTAAANVRFVSVDDAGRFVDKSLAAGTYVCGMPVFGSDPHINHFKRCEVAASAPPPAPPPPPPPPPGSDVVDASGNVIVAAYTALANASGSAAAIQHKLGLPSTLADDTLPMASAPTEKAWPLPGRPGTYQWGTLTDPSGDPGPYSSNSLSGIHLADDPNASGAFELGFGNVSNSVVGGKPEISWTQGALAATGINANQLRAQGKTVRLPVATCGPLGRAGWCLSGISVTADGLIFTQPSNTAHNLASCQLPANLAPFAIAGSNCSEFLAIACWNKTTFKGEVAFVAMVGLGDGASLTNQDPYPIRPDSEPNELHGWWGEVRAAMPGWPNLGNIAYMKYIGSVVLEDMHAPTGIAFTTGKNGASSGVPWGADPGYLAAGGDLTSWADLTPFTNEANRTNAMPGGAGSYDGLAHGGVVVVTSRSEKKVAFINVTPLWAYYEKMYLSPGTAGRTLFMQTVDVGDGAKWPFTFTAAPEQMPTVIKTVTLTEKPTCVEVAKWGTKRVWIGTENGEVQMWSLGDYPTKVGGPAGAAASIVLQSKLMVGANPTCIALPKEKAGGTIYPNILNEIIVCCRGDRAIKWVRYSGTTGTVVRTLRDKRIKDPVSIHDIDNHTTEYYLLGVADHAGRAVHGYRYGPIVMNGYPGTPTFSLADGSFEHTGAYNVAGKPIGVRVANIP